MDDKLGETQTDNTGYFKLVGTGSEVSRLNVKFNVYHRCGKTLPVCYYKYSWAVPQSYVSSGTYPQKTVRVYGKLTCKGQPYGGAKIKLYDHDTFTLDDKLAEGRSNADGTFDLEGMGNERTRLNVKMNIYHRCDKTIPLCYYKHSFPVPYTYISAGPRATNPYNVQTLELSMLEKERDCFNKK
ncbi:unnamed protein product, partial [Mesorhabditis belari]|uniref:Transthyretin-like family protein n=1 Tax=Mesorhabditis belari TaxID=2138241 RepID=A0AAF3F757_9BILA